MSMTGGTGVTISIRVLAFKTYYTVKTPLLYLTIKNHLPSVYVFVKPTSEKTAIKMYIGLLWLVTEIQTLSSFWEMSILQMSYLWDNAIWAQFTILYHSGYDLRSQPTTILH